MEYCYNIFSPILYTEARLGTITSVSIDWFNNRQICKADVFGRPCTRFPVDSLKQRVHVYILLQFEVQYVIMN